MTPPEGTETDPNAVATDPDASANGEDKDAQIARLTRDNQRLAGDYGRVSALLGDQRYGGGARPEPLSPTGPNAQRPSLDQLAEETGIPAQALGRVRQIMLEDAGQLTDIKIQALQWSNDLFAAHPQLKDKRALLAAIVQRFKDTRPNGNENVMNPEGTEWLVKEAYRELGLKVPKPITPQIRTADEPTAAHVAPGGSTRAPAGTPAPTTDVDPTQAATDEWMRDMGQRRAAATHPGKGALAGVKTP